MINTLHCECYLMWQTKFTHMIKGLDLKMVRLSWIVYRVLFNYCVCLVTQSCPALCNLMDCSPPGSSVRGDSPGKNTGVGCHALLQGSSWLGDWTQASALQADTLLSELPGKPKNTGVGSLSLLQGIFLTQESNRGLLHFRHILYQLSYQGSPLFNYLNP